MHFWSLSMSYEIKYEFWKENTKFNKLHSFYCVQGLNWSEKQHLLDLSIKYEKLQEF